ncbi:hypothetical protein A0H81_08087 [Grifola frondosa]|uniref:Fungal-type protein kinase domain-containing protein n=1 Tax=Grifola frondosa TaxID=5627 RepID=A0A1C7M4M7_GRIFR|nr:hypothetical protein A0H81_08087 [Grifola frondosa]
MDCNGLGTSELLHASFDVYKAMLDALEKGHRLHRDVSLNNIILVKDAQSGVRRGYLTDWELSCPDGARTPRRYERTATWQFMSARVISEEFTQQHHIQDDMESLLYVVLYCSLRWLPHNKQESALVRLLHVLFDRYDEIDEKGNTRGGDAKLQNSTSRKFTKKVRFTSKPLQKWFDKVMDLQHPTSMWLPENEYAPSWTDPRILADYWSRFLHTYTLDCHDRVSRILSHAPRDTQVSPHAATQQSRPTIGSLHFSALGLKRTRPFEGTGKDEGPKPRTTKAIGRAKYRGKVVQRTGRPKAAFKALGQQTAVLESRQSVTKRDATIRDRKRPRRQY